MPVQGALSRARLLSTFLGALLLVAGLVTLLAGVQLAELGGTWYFTLSGLGLVACGILLMAALRCALWLFSLCLACATVWALWEVGLDPMQLPPRLLVWFLAGLLLLLPVLRRGLRPVRRSFSLAHLVVALLLAGICLDPLAQVRLSREYDRPWYGVLLPPVLSVVLAMDDALGRVARLAEG